MTPPDPTTAIRDRLRSDPQPLACILSSLRTVDIGNVDALRALISLARSGKIHAVADRFSQIRLCCVRPSAEEAPLSPQALLARLQAELEEELRPPPVREERVDEEGFVWL